MELRRIDWSETQRSRRPHGPRGRSAGALEISHAPKSCCPGPTETRQTTVNQKERSIQKAAPQNQSGYSLFQLWSDWAYFSPVLQPTSGRHRTGRLDSENSCLEPPLLQLWREWTRGVQLHPTSWDPLMLQVWFGRPCIPRVSPEDRRLETF